MSPSQSFLAFVPPPVRQHLAAHAPALDALLAARWQSARQGGPGVALAAADFFGYAGARVSVSVESVEAVAALRFEELYLACACVAGDATALALVEARYLPALGATLTRMRLGHDVSDEVKQRLRRRLFTREGAREPKIAAYSGRGALGAWLCAVGVRIAIKLIRAEKGQPRPDDLRVARAASDANAELRYFKSHYRPLFRAAFADAVAGLGAGDKELLREYYGSGLTILQMAARRDTHRVTVSRWLDEARHRLLDRTRQELMRRVRVSQRECDSIMRLVQSQIDLTFHRLLSPG